MSFTIGAGFAHVREPDYNERGHSNAQFQTDHVHPLIPV